MKKIFYFILVCVVLSFAASCGLTGGDSAANDSDSLKLDTIALGDFEFKTTKVAFRDSLEQNGVMVYYDIDLDVPVSGPTKLVNTIRNWLNKELGGSYEGEYNFNHDMLAHYANAYFQECEDNDLFIGTGASKTTKVYVSDNTDKFVSYTVEGYDYTGGAHGMPYKYGVTFTKEEGTELGWNDIFSDTTKLKPLFKKGLSAYVDDKSRTDSMKYNIDDLLFDNVKTAFPMPSATPWLADSGVVYIYGAYEIAPYAIGMPEGTLLTKDVTQFLSDKTKELLKQ